MGDATVAEFRDSNPAGFDRAVTGLVLAIAAVATAVLLGWTFAVGPPKAGMTSMNPVTALCFEAAAIALWLLRKGPMDSGGRRALVAVLAVLIVASGVTKLIDLAYGTSLCLDNDLFAAQLDRGERPNRMAPNVAASFVLFGLALLVTDRGGWPRWLHPQYLVLPILAAALAALIGYSYDTSGFYKYKQYIPMALHTAICFMLAASALVLSRPREGFMQRIPLGTPGAPSFARILPVCVLVPAVLGAAQLYAVDHGWFSGRGTGTAIVCVMTILALSVLAFRHSAALSHAEALRREADARLQHQATHDPLTGLPNRQLFVERLQQVVSRTARHGISCALFYIDIDDFKPVNDRHGHQAGDELLKSIATRLRAAVRDEDTVARLGGDEFAVIMDAPSSMQEAMTVAHRVCDAVTASHKIAIGSQAVEVSVGISIGIAMFPGKASDTEALVRMADGAMYRAKITGKAGARRSSIELAA